MESWLQRKNQTFSQSTEEGESVLPENYGLLHEQRAAWKLTRDRTSSVWGGRRFRTRGIAEKISTANSLHQGTTGRGQRLVPGCDSDATSNLKIEGRGLRQCKCEPREASSVLRFLLCEEQTCYPKQEDTARTAEARKHVMCKKEVGKNTSTSKTKK